MDAQAGAGSSSDSSLERATVRQLSLSVMRCASLVGSGDEGASVRAICRLQWCRACVVVGFCDVRQYKSYVGYGDVGLAIWRCLYHDVFELFVDACDVARVICRFP